MDISEEKFTKIIRNNRGRLSHLCRVYCDREAEEDDLFQEILIQIWRSLPSFNGEAKLDTWIYRLAINTAISFNRRQNTRKKYYSDYKEERKAAKKNRENSSYNSGENEQLDKIYEAISTLDDSEKAIITMHLEGFSYAEISYVVDITENYVGVKLNRIRKKLSKIIGVNDGN